MLGKTEDYLSIVSDFVYNNYVAGKTEIRRRDDKNEKSGNYGSRGNASITGTIGILLHVFDEKILKDTEVENCL